MGLDERVGLTVSKWGILITMIVFVITLRTDIARRHLPVDARGASQRCPCGDPNIKRPSGRERAFLKCGLVTTRDHASAMEILRRGLSPQSLTAAQ